MNSLDPLLMACRAKHWKIGFTNGCFDNLHNGHIHLLTEARKYCDILFVGINDDKSVKLLKGKKRPFRGLELRVDALMQTELVAGVFPFHTEEDLLKIVMKLKPDVMIKGGDYVGVFVTGADYVRQLGGRVILIPLLYKQSSSRLNS